ncbi:MAG TPA: zinc-ribbon domain containing protein [Ktedonobacteraceae bacterium]|nr:zinc-ribbon domain containing protein [Ktedonobacteraceae bacterium]
MMSLENDQDRILTCRDCGQNFTFTVGEQVFYASRGLTNLPGRCPDCRAARRRGGGSGQSSVSHPRAEQFATICANCGKPTTVPFVPREGRSVYCSDCFRSQQPSRASRRDDSPSYSSRGSHYERGYSHQRSDDRRQSRW